MIFCAKAELRRPMVPCVRVPARLFSRFDMSAYPHRDHFQALLIMSISGLQVTVPVGITSL